ncbi:TetR/AcrR family transcriptional regulator [Lentzea sp. NPDC059081]|uniref:TetR/AcrR family transcriptional regulator n=1 Tax=Lentzea sp. NPDC059081 TaxID=3346719 RepID=UPI0036BF1CE6
MAIARETAPTRRGRETRARIVAVAAELFAADSVAGTSIEDVCAAAGVSVSQVYHYFQNKNGLVRAVIVHRAESAPDGDSRGLDGVAKLQRWCDNAIATQVERQFVGGCELGSLAAELAETDDDLRHELAEAFVRWEGPLRTGLRAMHGRGELVADADPDALAVVLLAALQGGILLTQTRRDVMPLKTSLDAAMHYVRAHVRQAY